MHGAQRSGTQAFEAVDRLAVGRLLDLLCGAGFSRVTRAQHACASRPTSRSDPAWPLKTTPFLLPESPSDGPTIRVFGQFFCRDLPTKNLPIAGDSPLQMNLHVKTFVHTS